MEHISLRQGAYLSILLILSCGNFVTAGNEAAASSTALTQPSYAARFRNFWNSAECRSRKHAFATLAEDTITAARNNPRAATTGALGISIAALGAPGTGGLLAASALGISNAPTITNAATTQAQILNDGLNTTVDRFGAQIDRINPIIAGLNTTFTAQQRELRTTLDMSMHRLQDIGTAVTQQINLGADQAIQSLGAASVQLTNQIGLSADTLLERVDRTVQSNITELSTASRNIVESINDAASNLGTEARLSIQFSSQTLVQTLGLGALGLTGAAVCYKNLINPTGEKSELFASIGAGITFASIAFARWMFNKDCQRESQLTQLRETRQSEQRTARAQAAADQQTRSENAARLRQEENFRRTATSFVQNVPATDASVARACKSAECYANGADALATSLAKKSIRPQEQVDQAAKSISDSLQSARENLNLAAEQLERKLQLKIAQIRERLALLVVNEQQSQLLNTQLDQQQTLVNQEYRHNLQLISEQRERLQLIESLVAKQLSNANEQDFFAASSPAASSSQE